MSLARIQEPPDKGLILLSGAPGTGKSTFGYNVAIKSVASERPVIFVTTEQSPAAVTGYLQGMGMPEAMELNFIDAFSETVGLTAVRRPDTIYANCSDLNSLSIAITKQQDKTGSGNTLLIFDSLTSPYLFNGAEIVKFMRLFLSRFASEGNSILALMDEGCGKEEDLGAMMSVADGIMKMELKESSRVINVVKHPRMEPTRIEVSIDTRPTIKSSFDTLKSAILSEPRHIKQWAQNPAKRAPLRREVGDSVNLFWPQLAYWSAMLWDPKGFPTMLYELNKEDSTFALSKEIRQYFPWRLRLYINFFIWLQSVGLFPKEFSQVKDMKKFAKSTGGGPYGIQAQEEQCGTIQYLEDISKTDEHYFRVYESASCWGFEDVGTAMASYLPPHMAGQVKGFERDGREWNAIETKCLGRGDPYCEIRLVPGEIGELKSTLEKDASTVEKIHERLLHRLIAFLLDNKPLTERPGLGSDVQLHPVMHGFGFPYLVLGGERYRLALRMGGARAGRRVGERLLESGLNGEETVKRVLALLEQCKVGKVAMDETIKIKDNCESIWAYIFNIIGEPSCYFTTGFLNGLFSAVKNQHVREIKCIAAGDPYCEWEII